MWRTKMKIQKTLIIILILACIIIKFETINSVLFLMLYAKDAYAFKSSMLREQINKKSCQFLFLSYFKALF